MKLIRLGVIAGTIAVSSGLLVALTTQSVYAKERAGAQKKAAGVRAHKGQKLTMLADKLGLTADQRTRIQSIHEAARQQAKAIRASGANDLQKREQLKTLHQDTKSQVQNVLTAQQRTQLQTLKEQRKAQHKAQIKNRLNALADRLGLSQTQRDQLKAARESFKSQAKAIKENGSLSAEQKREQLKALRQQHKAQMGNLLTEDQKAKLKSLHQQRKRAHGVQRGAVKAGKAKAGKTQTKASGVKFL